MAPAVQLTRVSMERFPDDASLRRVRLLVFDVDGVMTDGRVWVDAEGHERKVFHVRDGHGIDLARKAGVELALMTREAGGPAKGRARKLGVPLLSGVHDKGRALRDLRMQRGLAREEVIFVGDDAIDVAALREAGIPVAVADAHPEARGAARWITRARGGHGAVREVVDAVLRARGRHVDACDQEASCPAPLPT